MKRAIECPPSVRLTEDMEDSESVYAEEGTEAHLLLEKKVKEHFGIPFTEDISHMQYYSSEMEECTDIALNYIVEVYERLSEEGKHPFIASETIVDFADVVPEGFGSADIIIVYDGGIFIGDYKHGAGVEVSAKENVQLMIYAYGALQMFDSIYPISEVHMAILQPRISNISEWSISRDELLKWANEVVKPRAKLAYEGKGEYSCGSWCRFCKARSTCKHRASEMLALEGHKDMNLLSVEEIAEILSKIDALVTWSNDIKEYALTQALNGVRFPGFKLVEGRSIRKYSDEAKVVEVLEANNLDPYEKKLLSITELIKRIGKAQYVNLIEPLVVKPAGKPTLVPESDKRQEINSAILDFKEE